MKFLEVRTRGAVEKRRVPDRDVVGKLALDTKRFWGKEFDLGTSTRSRAAL